MKLRCLRRLLLGNIEDMRRSRRSCSIKPQPDLFGTEAAAPVYRPDTDKVRARLLRILGEARGASVLPWDRSQLSLYRIIFPQMSLFLPGEEGAQLRFQFETELARLEAA